MTREVLVGGLLLGFVAFAEEQERLLFLPVFLELLESTVVYNRWASHVA
jgi:hypothetical protein